MMMKKNVAIICMASLLATGIMLNGCGAVGDTNTVQADKKIMNVSLNPEVEFVLDDQNTVLSVNAVNEEGNLIVSAGVFTGKSAEEAVKLFMQISKETGFLISGNVNVGENEVDISFSGDAEEATEVYEEVKAELDAYFSEENITAQINQAAAITEEKLEELVAQCAPYLDEAKIKALEYMELIEMLYESRKETVSLYSQELKNAYYEAKAFAMEQAQLETLYNHLNEAQRLVYETTYISYSIAVTAIETTRATLLINENSLYQTSLAAFREAKTAYLKYRNQVAAMEQNEVTESVLAQLAEYERAVEEAEARLEQIAVDANQRLDELKAEVQTAYDGVVKCLGEVFEEADKYSKEISEKQKEAQTTFFTEFEKSHEERMDGAKKAWGDMKEDLQKGHGDQR